MIYRRAHCRNSVASIAYVRLATKLKNQSVFTEIAYLGGEKAGAERLDGRDTFGVCLELIHFLEIESGGILRVGSEVLN
jgi:hypothetical protein